MHVPVPTLYLFVVKNNHYYLAVHLHGIIKPRAMYNVHVLTNSLYEVMRLIPIMHVDFKQINQS